MQVVSLTVSITVMAQRFEQTATAGRISTVDLFHYPPKPRHSYFSFLFLSEINK